MSAAAFCATLSAVHPVNNFFLSHKSQRYLFPGKQEFDITFISLIHYSKITKVSFALG